MNFFATKKSREILIAEHEKMLKAMDNLYSYNNAYITNLTFNQEYVRTTQKVKLVSKNRISIANLELGNVHTNKFLLCRVLSRWIKMSAFTTVVEDPEGDVERIALYNWAQQSASNFLPIGTILAIKNPFYKVAMDSNIIIRADNPNDVIVLDHNNKLMSEVTWATDPPEGKKTNVKGKKSTVVDKKSLLVDDFRRRGNDCFASNDFAAAIDKYSKGIEKEPHNVTLLANRAEAYLRLSQFEKALTDAETALKHDHGHLKAAFRKGKALYGLKRYQEAIVTLQALLQTSTDDGVNQRTEQLLKDVEMLDSESRNGRYDYVRIVDEFYEKAKIKENKSGGYDWVCETGPRLDHADYLIDDIEIRHAKKRGRCWVAKCDIPEHTLLMVSKAFRIVYSNEKSSNLSIDFSSRTINSATPSKSELITRITQKLIAEPGLCQEVYQLYSGPGLVPMEKLDENLLRSVDKKRIKGIVEYNSFDPMDFWYAFPNIRENGLLFKGAGTGLWVLPSYFNHSCVDTNVNQLFLGDLMFLRSCRPILKGEELVLSYCNPLGSYEERTKHLKSYDINCQCQLCKLEASEKQKIKLKRSNILETYENSIKPRVYGDCQIDPSLIKELTDMISEIQNLREEHLELVEFQLFKLKISLALVYAKNGNPRQSLTLMHDVYNFLKKTHLSYLIGDAALQISTRYSELGQIQMAKEWFDVTLKEFAEPLRGKFKDEETRWREEALHLTEKLLPDMISVAKNAGLI